MSQLDDLRKSLQDFLGSVGGESQPRDRFTPSDPFARNRDGRVAEATGLLANPDGTRPAAHAGQDTSHGRRPDVPAELTQVSALAERLLTAIDKVDGGRPATPGRRAADAAGGTLSNLASKMAGRA